MIQGEGFISKRAIIIFEELNCKHSYHLFFFRSKLEQQLAELRVHLASQEEAMKEIG